MEQFDRVRDKQRPDMSDPAQPTLPTLHEESNACAPHFLLELAGYALDTSSMRCSHMTQPGVYDHLDTCDASFSCFNAAGRASLPSEMQDSQIGDIV